MNDNLARLVTVAATTRTFTKVWNDAVAEIERILQTSRRNFLGALLGTAGAAVLNPVSILPAAIDPEIILPRKTIVIPDKTVAEISLMYCRPHDVLTTPQALKWYMSHHDTAAISCVSRHSHQWESAPPDVIVRHQYIETLGKFRPKSQFETVNPHYIQFDKGDAK